MFGFVGCNRSSSNNASLSIAEINDRQVVGYLRLPLTETTMLHATIVDGATLRMKQYTSSYLLSVTSVNGVPLASDRLFRFMVPLVGRRFLRLLCGRGSLCKGNVVGSQMSMT